MSHVHTVPARRGKAVRLARGQAIRIINLHGKQIVDTWAFVAGDMPEYMGMAQCRAFWGRLFPVVGDRMVTNRRRPILILEADTSPGRHDTLIAPCDAERYGLLGCTDYHDNCKDNLHAGLAELGLYIPYTPDSLNVFMNIPWHEDGRLDWGVSQARPGDSITLRAEIDCVVALSCCPQDILPINDGKTVETQYEILD